VRNLVRRSVPATVAVVALSLAVAGSAAATLQPLTSRSDLANVLARGGTGARALPAQRAAGHATVIVTLGLEPLAAARGDRSIFSLGGRRKLSLSSTSSRAYLARIDAGQQRAIRTLRAAIPAARVDHRYRIVLDGFSVDLPAARLPQLMRLGFVDRVYQSQKYTLSMNDGPGVIGGPALRAATGAGGDGVKVAVVDDGIDPKHPFLSGAGLSYPAGFPKGVDGFTTPKVIAARAFFPKTSTSEARQPLDESSSFHGTFVAGVIGGVEGTTAPASVSTTCVLGSGGCHPKVTGLSGVAPHVWLGNYRVFSLPAPLGGCCSANTPEIVAAFESAVADGMDVINFSGGGPQSDPDGDPFTQVVANVVKAGVVPVISAGNDRDLFGMGTVGSPSTATDAISVAATANAHIFTNAFTLTAPTPLGQLPFVPNPGGLPQAWSTTDQKLVDVGAITGTDGKPVGRQLCSATLPAQSVAGLVVLVSRGGCSYEQKGFLAASAGATGILVSSDQPGDPEGIPFRLSIPGGSVSDLDGARIRQAVAATGGRGTFRVTRDTVEVPTSWGGVPTSFSSAGLTAFGHQLKPDISAVGAQVISSTLVEFAGDQYAVLDGTSFSAPHIAGAVALLLQRHPSWTPKQVKSALMSTAGPAWGDTGRTIEAPISIEGAGLAKLPAADTPYLFTDPQSLSFGDMNVTTGAATRTLLVSVSDAGGGSGTWQVMVQPQFASSGVTVSASPAISVAPGGLTTLQVTANATAAATPGDEYGFVILQRSGVTRRIPYGFSVIRPTLANAQVTPLARIQTADTRSGTNRARLYRYPTEPFGILGLFGLENTAIEDGAEHVYSIDIPAKTVNFGAVVVDPALDIRAPVADLLDANAPIHPWLLGSLDESNVQGYGGTPINMNGYMPDFIFNVGATGAVLPAAGTYYIAVDSGKNPFTGKPLAGRYVLRSWIDDVTPPKVKLLTTRLAAGRPSIVARVTDAKSGVDPLSLLLLYKTTQIPAHSFDPQTGIAVFQIPKDVTALTPGPSFMRLVASDFQEAKNVSTPGDEAMPNTRFLGIRIDVVKRPAVTWLAPVPASCAPRKTELLVAASSAAAISSVGFFDGKRQIARVKRSDEGIYRTIWRRAGAKSGTHVLSAVVSDVAGRESRATRTVRVCKG
jgi:minor extracellular serine protease Vpr